MQDAPTAVTPPGRVRALLARPEAPRIVLALGIGLWAATFYRLAALRHQRFGTFGFDLAIYDQGVWLLSRPQDPFVTIRGIDLFGHHTNFVLLLVAPLYRLGGGPELLLALQVASQAAGAVAAYLIGRDRLASRWLGVAFAAVLLLNPTYQFLVWEFFHPDALGIAPLLFAYWAARERRWRWFAVAAVLALACKEDFALAVLVIGVLVAMRGDRRVGAWIGGLSLAYFVVATRVLIPWFNGIGPFYDSFFALGDDRGEQVRNVVTRPFEGDRLEYYRRILLPFAGLPLLAPATLAIAAPMVGVIALTAYPHTRDFRFHYSAIVVAAALVASVEAVAWLARTVAARRALTAVVLAAALLTSVSWGISPIGADYRSGYWPLVDDARNEARAGAVDMVPARESTSATYNLAPHLAHRPRIYEFPVPWRNVNWGVDGEGLHDPATVRWLAVDRSLLGDDDRALLDVLLEVEFEVRMHRDDVVVAERVAPPSDPAEGSLGAAPDAAPDAAPSAASRVG